MSKKRNYRKKIVKDEEEKDDDGDEEEGHTEYDDVTKTLQDRKELQKIRQRKVGVTAEDLLTVEKEEQEETPDASDPFKMKSGGGLTQVAAKSITISELGTNFSTETNQRDEDVQLLKYIEDGLKKKKGVTDETGKNQRRLSGEDRLYELPENINVKSKIMKSEEMLSSQMLSGIPEVDLGIEAKIKNIEATEEAKMKMVDDGKNRRKESSEFVPTNMASNFMHHSRFYNEKEVFEKERKKEEAKQNRQSENKAVEKGPTVGEEIVENTMNTNYMKKAMNSNCQKRRNKNDTTDDYMFENFKKKAKDGRWR